MEKHAELERRNGVLERDRGNAEMECERDREKE